MQKKKYFSGSRQGSSKRAQTKSTAIVCMILSPIYLIYSMLSIFFNTLSQIFQIGYILSIGFLHLKTQRKEKFFAIVTVQGFL